MEPSFYAISPVDGRYRKVTEKLSEYFSEAAIIQYRVATEVEYFIALCKSPLPQLIGIDKKVFPKLRRITSRLNEADVIRIKEIEKEPTMISRPLNIF